MKRSVDLSLILFKLKQITRPEFLQRGAFCIYFRLKEIIAEMEKDPDYMDAVAAEFDGSSLINEDTKAEIRETLFKKSPLFRKRAAENPEGEEFKSLKEYTKKLLSFFKTK